MSGDEELPAGLVRADPTVPGLGRRRRGRGFSYHDEHGTALPAGDALVRVKALVILPAWQDVWISTDAGGHIQAVGTDAAGRRQYRYHDEWRRARDADKHDRVLELGARMGPVRAEILRRLAGTGLSATRVLAGGVRLLDIGVFRAGGEQYAPAHGGEADAEGDGTFGLATLRREHVRLRRGTVEFSYLAKGGIPRSLVLRDPPVHRLVNGLLRRRGGGGDLLAHRVGRAWHDVRSEDLNTAVKALLGDEFTAKDLRTWNATVLAAVTLAQAASGTAPTSLRARNTVVVAAMRTVSEHLGNTPTVARASYVDPRIVERFVDGHTVLPALRRAGFPDPADDAGRAVLERAVVRLIRDGR